MLPAGVTIAAIMTDATSVVSEFGTLIVLVVGLGFGLYVVKKLPQWIKAARS